LPVITLSDPGGWCGFNPTGGLVRIAAGLFIVLLPQLRPVLAGATFCGDGLLVPRLVYYRAGGQWKK
jgi:hypothetical protein